MQFPDSELIINPNGSIYHLNLLPEDIAQTIITVGDPEVASKNRSSFECAVDLLKSFLDRRSLIFYHKQHTTHH